MSSTPPFAWRPNWKRLMSDHPDGVDVFFEFRPDKITVLTKTRAPRTAKITAQPTRKQVWRELSPLFDKKLRKVWKGCFTKNTPFPADYASYTFKKNKQTIRCQVLPVYPLGMDMILAFPATRCPSLSDLNFPADLHHTLTRLAQMEQGVFAITGTTGSGREELINALIIRRRALKNQDVLLVDSPFSILPGARKVSISSFCHPPQLASAVNPPVFTPDFFNWMAKSPVVANEELMRQIDATMLWGAAICGNPVFFSFNASSCAPVNLLARLDDFGVAGAFEVNQLQASASTRFLPLLCQACAKSVPSSLQKTNNLHGCEACDHTGVSGRQMVVSVFEWNQGRAIQLHNHLEQANYLVQQGKVSQDDAQNVLGPLGSPAPLIKAGDFSRPMSSQDPVWNKFLLAAYSSDVALAQKIFSAQGLSVNHMHADGQTPLTMSCSIGSVAIADFLIQQGADPHLKNGASQTPLHEAMMSKNADQLVDLLLKSGVDALNAQGQTALAKGLNVLSENHRMSWAPKLEKALVKLIHAGANLSQEHQDARSLASYILDFKMHDPNNSQYDFVFCQELKLHARTILDRLAITQGLCKGWEGCTIEEPRKRAM